MWNLLFSQFISYVLSDKKFVWIRFRGFAKIGMNSCEYQCVVFTPLGRFSCLGKVVPVLWKRPLYFVENTDLTDELKLSLMSRFNIISDVSL